MWNGYLRIGFFFVFVAVASVVLAQQSSGLVGTWTGKVEGYEIEMRMVLKADGTADYEGALGRWRVQGNKLLLTQEGETVAYNFTLRGSQLSLSGGDLMAPLVLTRARGAARGPGGGGFAPPAEEPQEGAQTRAALPHHAQTSAAPAPSKRALDESELGRLLEAGVSSQRLIDLVNEMGVGFSLTPALTSKLKAKGATNELIAAVRRAGEAQAHGAAAKASGDRPFGRASDPSVASDGNGGSRQDYEPWGLSFVVPPGWKVGERPGLLLMGSDTEAGLIVLRLVRRRTLEQLVRDYGEGIEEEGLRLMPTMQAQDFPAGRNPAVAGELAGTSQDGARIRARTVSVASPFGDAAVVLGMTTEEKYAGLKPRVESIARSFAFRQPKAPPVLEAIAGQWFYISTSSFGSSERYLNLCSDGRFSESSNIYSSGSAGTAYGERGGGTARWSAEGNANQGTVTVTYPNGSTSQFQYRRGGGGLYVGGRKYVRYGDGSCTKTSVY